MKIVAGLAVVALLGLATQSFVSAATGQVPALQSPTANVERATPAMANRLPSTTNSQPARPARPPSAQREWLRAGAPNKLVLFPKDRCQSGTGFDVLVHFHGVPVTAEPNVRTANLDAAAVIVNWGIGSGAYENRFQNDGSLCAFLDSIERSVDKACGTPVGGVRRVALSAWSAGYGAIYRILFHEKDAARVDAVLLADGLHAGYVKHRQVNPLQMQGFKDFADRAARGEKLFAISHSEVTPMRYASTAETADFLIQQTGLERILTDEPGARRKMHLTSRADREGFHVRGFSGGGLDDHSQHLYGIGETLWSLLDQRWSSR
jgi:hypothetical protein